MGKMKKLLPGILPALCCAAGGMDQALSLMRMSEHMAGSAFVNRNGVSFKMDSKKGLVVLDKFMTKIPEGCFRDTFDMSYFRCEPGSLLRRIEEEAFAGSEDLLFVIIPSSVEFIGRRCFANCPELCGVVFEQDSMLKTLAEDAFIGCPKLKPEDVIGCPPIDNHGAIAKR
jgi:hypothetical protein